MMMRRRTVAFWLAVPAALIALACLCVWLRTAGFRTNGEVIGAVMQYWLGEKSPPDVPCVLAIDCGHPHYEFVVTRGRAGKEVVVAAGRLNRCTWELRERPTLPRTIWDVFPKGKRATFPLPRDFSDFSEKEALASLHAVAPEESLDTIQYPWQYMWKYAVAKKWFRSDERVKLIFIDRYPETVLESCSWYMAVDFAQGSDLTEGGIHDIYFEGMVNLKTLKITEYPDIDVE